jgi:hypothetical protein
VKPTSSGRPVTHESVSLSLEALVEELANHVPPEKRPQVELLRRLAHEKPDQHVRVKQQMIEIGGADALRAAVSALCDAGNKAPAAAAPAPSPAPPPPVWPTGVEPPMPPSLPQIFGSTASTPQELQDFKTELLHAFHCRTPSCPISGCAGLSAKLQRLQLHISSCTENTCLLCSIWTYLRNYHAAAAMASSVCAAASAPDFASAGGGPSLQDMLGSSQMLLPFLQGQQGKGAWASDAFSSMPSLYGGGTCLPCASSTDSSILSAKRARGASDLPMPGDMFQGPLPWNMTGSGLDGLGAGAVPRVPASAAVRPSAPPGPTDSLAANTRKRGASAAFDLPPLTACSSGMVGGVGFENSRSFNLSGNLNLSEILKSTSMGDLNLGSLKELCDLGDVALAKYPSGPDLGLSLQKNGSELKDANLSMLGPGLSLQKNGSELKGANLSAFSVGGLFDIMDNGPNTPRMAMPAQG